MAQRRIYEIARQRDLPTAQVLRMLRSAGIDGKRPASDIDEGVAAAVLDPHPDPRPLEEIAGERGVPVEELVRRLEAAGVRIGGADAPVSEPLLDAALSAPPRNGRKRGDGNRAPRAELRPRNGGSSHAGTVSPEHDATRADVAASLSGAARRPAPSERPSRPSKRPPLLERLPLHMRLWQLRRERRAQLRELSGLAVELVRLGTPRQDLLDARLREAAATDDELIGLERLLEPETIGGTCPDCGTESEDRRHCPNCGATLPGRHWSTRMSIAAGGAAALALALAWLFGGLFRGGPTPAPRASVSAGAAHVAGASPVRHHPRTVAAVSPYVSVVATARPHVTNIRVYHARGERHAYMTLSNPNIDGAQLVFLVKQVSGDWLHVYLPVRPNGSIGWIKARRVTLAHHSFRLLINLGRHFLTIHEGPRLMMRTPVGVGRAVTPTPPGLYYLTELLKQPDPAGVYGPWAFGLSAHSNVLHEFAGRDGILGIHGTDYPQGIGTNVSHGCIRVSNAAIERMARTLPLGTPVRIVRD